MWYGVRSLVLHLLPLLTVLLLLHLPRPAGAADAFATVPILPAYVEIGPGYSPPQFTVVLQSSVFDAAGPGTRNVVCPSQLECLPAGACTVAASSTPLGGVNGVGLTTGLQLHTLPVGVAGSANEFRYCATTLQLTAAAASNAALSAVQINGRFAALMAKGNNAYVAAQLQLRRTSESAVYAVEVISPPPMAATAPQPLTLVFTGTTVGSWLASPPLIMSNGTTAGGFFCCPTPASFSLVPAATLVQTTPVVSSIATGTGTVALVPPCAAVVPTLLSAGVGSATCPYTVALPASAVTPATAPPSSVLSLAVRLSTSGAFFPDFSFPNSTLQAIQAQTSFSATRKMAIGSQPLEASTPPVASVGTDAIVCSVLRCVVDVETDVVAPTESAYTFYAQSCMWRPNGTTTGTLAIPGAGVAGLVSVGAEVSETDVAVASNPYYTTMRFVHRFSFDLSGVTLTGSAASAGTLTIRGPYYNFWSNPPCWVTGTAGNANNTLATIAVHFHDPAAVAANAFSARMASATAEALILVTAPLVAGIGFARNASGIAVVPLRGSIPPPALFPAVTIQQTGLPATLMTVPAAKIRWDVSQFQLTGVYSGTVDITGLAVQTVGHNYTVTITPPFFNGVATWIASVPVATYPKGVFNLEPAITPFEAACTIEPGGRATLPRFGTRRIKCSFRVDTRKLTLLFAFSLGSLTVRNTSACTEQPLTSAYIVRDDCTLEVTGATPFDASYLLLRASLRNSVAGSQPFEHTLRTVAVAPVGTMTNVPLEVFPSIVALVEGADPPPFDLLGPIVLGDASLATAVASAPPPPIRVIRTLRPSGDTLNLTFASSAVTWRVPGVQWGVAVGLTAPQLVNVTGVDFALVPVMFLDGVWVFPDDGYGAWNVPPATVEVRRPPAVPTALVPPPPPPPTPPPAEGTDVNSAVLSATLLALPVVWIVFRVASAAFGAWIGRVMADRAMRVRAAAKRRFDIDMQLPVAERAIRVGARARGAPPGAEPHAPSGGRMAWRGPSKVRQRQRSTSRER